MAKIVVGLYPDLARAEAVVAALVDAGCNRKSVSLVANHRAAEGKAGPGPASQTTRAGEGLGVGALVGGLAGLLVGLGSFALPGIGAVAIAGPLLAMVAGASIGGAAGTLIGVLMDIGVPEHAAHSYAEGLRRGNVVVLVQTSDDAAAALASVMGRYQPLDLDTLTARWRQAGWTEFDPDRPPLDPEELAEERARTMAPPIIAGAESGPAEVERQAVRIHASALESEEAQPPPTADATLRDGVIDREKPFAEKQQAEPAPPQRKADRPVEDSPRRS